MIAALVFVLSALLTAPVRAAPACQDGIVAQCASGTTGITATSLAQWRLPIHTSGWHVMPGLPGDQKYIWDAVVFLGLLLALLALLPNFDRKEWDSSGDQKDPDK
jgi:hypothetical protein